MNDPLPRALMLACGGQSYDYGLLDADTQALRGEAMRAGFDMGASEGDRSISINVDVSATGGDLATAICAGMEAALTPMPPFNKWPDATHALTVGYGEFGYLKPEGVPPPRTTGVAPKAADPLDTPQARARYAIDNPDVLHTPGEFRQILGELLAMIGDGNPVAYTWIEGHMTPSSPMGPEEYNEDRCYDERPPQPGTPYTSLYPGPRVPHITREPTEAMLRRAEDSQALAFLVGDMKRDVLCIIWRSMWDEAQRWGPKV